VKGLAVHAHFVATYPNGRVRGLVVWASACATLASALVVVGEVEPAPAVVKPPVVREAPDAASAVEAARRQGSQVEVTAERTATRTVYANPDGTHTARISAVPTRAKRGNEWVPIDTTLTSRSDGLVLAKATEVEAALSGGGSAAPLLRVRDGGRELVLYWPGALPKPILAGNEATYRDVLPGVDLVMRATARGYQQLLVVKAREAARNPALARVGMRVQTRGLRLSADRSGALTAVDAAGKPVFASPPSVMWDASGPELARSAPVGVTVASGVLTLVPDQKFLADPATVYPVTVDPKVESVYASQWVNLLSGLATPQWNQSADPDHRGWAQVGQCNNTHGNCGGIGEGWAYFQFETAFLGDKDVLSAKFFTTVAHSPDCGIHPHLLNVLHYAIPGNITFGNKPEWNPPRAEFGAPNSCGVGRGVELNVLGSLNGAGPTTFYLHAKNGNDQNAWRKYVAAETRIEVKWNRQPHTPRNLRTDPPTPAPCRWCDGKPYLSAQTVSLNATLDDPDSDKLRPRWRVTKNYANEDAFDWDKGTCDSCHEQASGANHNLNYSLVGKENQEIRWWVHGDDGERASPLASGQMFVPDYTKPGGEPSVTSSAYPDAEKVLKPWAGAAGSPGEFTFGPGADCAPANQVCDIDHYLYDWKEPPTAKVDANALGGTASVMMAPWGWGPQTLFVQSVDRAGNKSATRKYKIKVRDGVGPRGHWAFEGNTKDTAYLGDRHGTLNGDVTYTDGAVGTGVLLNGGYVSAPQALNTDVSFTVSAWVRADQPQSVVMGAVSQEGAENSGWFLNYRGDDNRWTFMMAAASGTPEARYVMSKEPARLGQWTHLTGAYDRSTHTIKLYVNGVLNNSMALPDTIVPWRAEGPLNVGREKWKGQYGNSWRGAIDEVRTYDRILTDAEIQALVSRDNVRTGHWKFDDAPMAGEVRNTVAENAVAGGSHGRLQGGARFVATDGGGAVELNGAPAQVVTGGPAVHTDQSFTVSAVVTARGSVTELPVMTAVSQDSPGNSGFYLQRNAANKWVFGTRSSQTDTTNAWNAVAGQAAQAGVPTRLTGVYDGVTRELTLYVNDEYGGRAVIPSGATPWNATGPLVVGRARLHNVGEVDFWKGTVDDVRTFSRKLAPEEILKLAAEADTPTASWRLDGDTTDAAGDRDGAWAGTPQWTEGQNTDPGPADRAVQLTGTNAISAPHAITTTESYTVAAWVKLDASTGCHCTILSQDAQHTGGLALSVGAEGKWSMFASSGDNANAVPNGSWAMLGEEQTAQAGVWTHVAGVHNKKREQLELYINGALVQSTTFKNPINASGRLQIGRLQWYAHPGTYVNQFRGAIDDVRVCGRALFADEIRTMAGRDLSLVHSWQLNDATGSATVDSIGSRGGTVHGGATFGPGRMGSALQLDGTDDAVSTTGVDVRSDRAFTVTAWVKLTDPPPCPQVCARTAVSLDGGQGTSKFRLGHLIDQNQAPDPGKWIFEMPEQNGDVTRAAISVNPSQLGAWVLLVGVYDATTKQIELYVYSDDPTIGVDRETGVLDVPWRGTGGLQIGRALTGGTPGQYWQGGVDDVRVYTGNLSAARLNALYASYPAVTR
jgi:hypothetical protein